MAPVWSEIAMRYGQHKEAALRQDTPVMSSRMSMERAGHSRMSNFVPGKGNRTGTGLTADTYNEAILQDL